MSETNSTQICLIVRLLLNDLFAERVVTTYRIYVAPDILITGLHNLILWRLVKFIFAAIRLVILLIFCAMEFVLNKVSAGVALLVV